MEAEEFLLKDASGEIRAKLGFLPGRGPGLAILDNEWKTRIGLRVWADGTPRLTLFDKDGEPRALLGSTSLLTTRMGEVEQRPESSLVFFDKAGKAVWRAP